MTCVSRRSQEAGRFRISETKTAALRSAILWTRSCSGSRSDRRLHQPSPEQVEKRIQDIRAAHPGAASAEAWHDTLARYGLNETELQSRVTRQLALLREADIRLRPSVQIENAGIEAYYRDVFLPQLHKAGAADVPLTEVSGQIREILTQEKIDQLFNSWLESLRKESKVRTLLPDETTPSAGEATR